jgi:hypothetical protein
MAQRFRPSPINDEFVGVADYVMKLINDLLVSDLESFSDLASSQGSYHPLRECFMVEIVDDTRQEVTPEGHIVNANDGAPHGGNRSPPCPVNGHGATADVEVPPYPRMNQLQER